MVAALANSIAEPWTEPDGSGVMLFSEGDALFDSMLADIAAARERVWVESYIFADDAIGREFVARLAESAARGVDVRVRVDAVGSRFGFSGGSARRLGTSGARFRWCHPWEWRRPWTFHRRNHRKLLIVDERAAYLGGFNIAEINSRRVHGNARWRDTHVRLTGPIVRDAAAAYAAFAQGELEWCGDEDRPLYLLTNHARHCRYRWRCLVRHRFAEARRRIWLTTPYFVPDSATQRRLCEAALRGVDVRVLVPGKSDVWVVQWAGRAAYSQLLRAGVRIFEYQPRTLHAKALVVDGRLEHDRNREFRLSELLHQLRGQSRRALAAHECGARGAVRRGSARCAGDQATTVGCPAAVEPLRRAHRLEREAVAVSRRAALRLHHFVPSLHVSQVGTRPRRGAFVT